MLDGRRLPVGPLVLGEQLVLDLGGADEPGRQRVVEQRRVAPPAVRVAVLVRLRPEQQPPVGEIPDQRPVGVLEEHPADHRHRVLEPAVRPDGIDHGQSVRPPGLHVVRAERGR